ncbi:MAG: CoA ester lyase [Rickettsiales bacterium TMED289]|nr:MAG: CoA ester lyase [Rickettsiales bacterium TMED289]|tara:strand:- start:1183 stop:2040 length:858 start_codon:yes stop_codon:yes gene_type:complete
MDLNKIKVRRSFIFTPGLNPEMFPKALASGADMVCIELEDGIAIKDKDEARKNTINALKTLEVKNDVELVVRVNCQRTKPGLLDLEAFISSKLKVKALMLPKVKTPDEISFIDDLLNDCNLETDLHVIMETNEALENIYDIAHSSRRIVALYFGGVDMAAELRVPNNYENLIYARSKLVHAGASVGVDVIDVPYLDLEDMDGMKKEAELVRNLGFTGKGSIHPKQIAILNQVFTPSKDEITKAKKIIDQFNASDTGLVVIDGKLIEKPVLREMQRQILVADKINQ